MSLRIAQHFDRVVATSIFQLTTKAAAVIVLALVTGVCMLNCAQLAQYAKSIVAD